jgi:hypothetical protein
MKDEKSAESSPADQPEAQEPEPQDAAVEEAAESEKEEPQSSKETVSDDEGKPEESGEIVTSSEDAKPSVQEEKPKDSAAERRIKQLWAKNKALEEALKQKGIEPESTKPLEEPVEPDIAKYDTVEAFKKAQEEFKKKHAEYVRELTIREQKEVAAKERIEAESKKIEQSFIQREAETKKRHSDYDRNEATFVVRPSETMKYFISRSSIGPEILYEMQQNPELADRVRDLDPDATYRELIKLETEATARIKGIKKAPRKDVPTYVSDKGAAPAEDVPLWEKLYK